MPDELINGFQMHYEVYGEGPTLVMIHGGLGGGEGSAAMVEHHASILARRFRVIFYDRRAAGRSGTPEDGYSLESYSQDLYSLLQRLDVPRAHVLGSSAGGPIAIRFALDHPEMTETLLLINTMSYARQTERAVRQQELEHLQTQLGSGDARTAAATALRDRWPDLAQTDPAGFQRLVEANSARVEAIAQTIQSYLDIGDSLETRLGELTMPTLIVHGDADSRIPLACGQELQNHIQQAELYIIPGAEHGLLSNEPRLVRNVIYGFLERVAPAVAASSPS